MTRPTVSLEQLNSLDRAAFVAAIGHVFEDSPWIAEATWPQRPFGSLDALHQALCATVYAAGQEQQLALIQAHPDLVGRAALAGGLGAESSAEQAAAGLGTLSAEEIARFQQFNAAYRERFGFPFVICARENKKDSILAGFAARLPNSHEQEIATALGEIAKIARLRLADVVR
jgi:OHCU decarboxylase